MATAIVRFDTRDVQQAMRRYKTRFPRAIRRALRRGATSARTQLARDVARDMKVPVRTARDAITIRDIPDGLGVFATVKRLSLYDFLPGRGNPRGPYPSRGRRKLRIRGKVYDDAFVARMPNGSWGVFRRVSDASSRRSRGAWSANLPIVKLRGASIWQSAKNHAAAAQARGLESLRKNLASELNFAANIEQQR